MSNVELKREQVEYLTGRLEAWNKIACDAVANYKNTIISIEKTIKENNGVNMDWQKAHVEKLCGNITRAENGLIMKDGIIAALKDAK